MLHEQDGFLDYYEPKENIDYNPVNEKLGEIYKDVINNRYNRYILNRSQEEIQSQIKAEKENERQQLVQQKLEIQILESAQAELDDTIALDNQALYPFWEVGVNYTIGFKVQAFDGIEVFLYKCVQAHTSQADWQPKNVPALFTKVAYPGQIPVWVQPTGAQDAYNIGDQVHYPTESDPVYESLINANVWSPVAYPQGWQIV